MHEGGTEEVAVLKQMQERGMLNENQSSMPPDALNLLKSEKFLKSPRSKNRKNCLFEESNFDLIVRSPFEDARCGRVRVQYNTQGWTRRLSTHESVIYESFLKCMLDQSTRAARSQ